MCAGVDCLERCDLHTANGQPPHSQGNRSILFCSSALCMLCVMCVCMFVVCAGVDRIMVVYLMFIFLNMRI